MDELYSSDGAAIVFPETQYNIKQELLNSNIMQYCMWKSSTTLQLLCSPCTQEADQGSIQRGQYWSFYVQIHEDATNENDKDLTYGNREPCWTLIFIENNCQFLKGKKAKIRNKFGMKLLLKIDISLKRSVYALKALGHGFDSQYWLIVPWFSRLAISD